MRGRGGGGGERDASPARPPSHSLPPGRASALTLRGEGELPGSGEGGGSACRCRRRHQAWPCRCQSRRLLPQFRFPTASPVRRPRSRARVPPCGLRSLMTSRAARTFCAAGSRPQGRRHGFGPAPPPARAVQGACAQEPRRKGTKAKVTELSSFPL